MKKSEIQRLPYEDFKSIYSRVPRVTVEILIINRDGIVLIFRDINPYKDEWHIPGGTILFGESVKKATERVAKEELNVKVRIKRISGIIEYPSEKKKGAFTQSIGIACECEILSGKIAGSKQGKEVGEFKKLPRKIILDQKKFLIQNYPRFRE